MPYFVPYDDARRFDNNAVPKIELTNLPAQSPSIPDSATAPTAASPWYNPRSWSLKTKLIVAGVTIAVVVVVVVVVVVATVVGVVKGKQVNRYPDYKRLEYHLVDDYMGKEFFDRFNYFSAKDPTDGFVKYVNRPTAQNLNLTYVTDNSAVVKVDTSEPFAASGRQSVRIESKAQYNHGLFIFDILHSPFACGLWPALWLTDGYSWPANGEIDIVETNNMATEGNSVTLHSTDGCNMKDVKREQTGTTQLTSCDDSMHGEAGCGVQGPPDSYGEWLNGIGGGVYALELREAGIRTWFFRRDEIPSDISTTPDPSTWGTALADFPNTNCDIPSHFANQSIIVNIDLCGQLGANPLFYTEQYRCPGTCEDFVARNPESFQEAYWEFGGFRVYQAE